MLTLTAIEFSNDGRRVNYRYVVDKKYLKYFRIHDPFWVEYDVDIRRVPLSITVIPFLSNVMPIAWFLGMDVSVDEVDKTFVGALYDIKEELSREWIGKSLQGDLKSKRICTNAVAGERVLMLYSGGVDSVTTYLRHRGERPDLVTFLGADMRSDDVAQWERLAQFMDSHELVRGSTKHKIKGNFRQFYTYRVDLLANLDWWGKVQHGLGLLGANAPLSYVHGYKRIYLASSVARFAWGSHPGIDDRVRWANVTCKNDGSELSRQDKIDLLVDFKKTTKTPVKVRVCYSELNRGVNCSKCEKCYRTIVGIVLAGDNPNEYGFSVDGDLYSRVFEFFNSITSTERGKVVLWKDIAEKAERNDTYFVLENREREQRYVKRIASGELTRVLEQKLNKNARYHTWKFVLTNRHFHLHRAYRFFKAQLRPRD